MNERRLARWVEISLLAALIALSGFAGFVLGRITAGDPDLAFERGRAEGRAAERLRREQNRIETDILEEMASAVRQSSEKTKTDQPEASEKTTETATGASD